MTTKFVFKVILMGEDSVGKSSLLKRYAENQFSDGYNATIGIDFRAKEVELNGQAIQAQIWDTSGQERLGDISNKIHYRGWDGAVIVFDLTNRSTFKQVENWLTDIEHLSGTDLPKVLVGNKCDMTTKRCVKSSEAKSLAVINNMDYVETSAKTDTDVESAFETLLEEICSRTKKEPEIVAEEDVQPKKLQTAGGGAKQAGGGAKQEESLQSEDAPAWAGGIFKELQKFNSRMDAVEKRLDDTVKSMSKRMDSLEMKMSKLSTKK